MKKPAAAEESARGYDIAPVHIPTNYQHYKRHEKNRMLLGKLEYFTSTREEEFGNKTVIRGLPPFIGITSEGELTISAYEYELNYFLQNHPLNEEVKNNPSHPNHDPKMESCFTTYVPQKLNKAKMDFHEEVARMLQILMLKHKTGEHVVDFDRLRAMARHLLSSGKNQFAPLIGAESMDEEVLRDRMLNLVSRYPHEIARSQYLMEVSFIEDAEKWLKAGVIELQATDGKKPRWVWMKGSSPIEICEVNANLDTMNELVRWFSEDDEYNKMHNQIAEYVKERKTEKA